ALVLGAGPVGLLGAMLLAHNGFDTHVYSREDQGSKQAEIVESIGGTYISAGDVDAPELPDACGRVDLVYEAAGATQLAFDVFEVLNANAVYVFTGVPGRKTPIDIDADELMRDLVLKNQLVFGTVNADRGAFEDAVRDLSAFRDQWPDAIGELISGRFDIDEHEALFSGEVGGIKNVVTIHSGATRA
ncbi:MAG: hypothetical protein ABEN55_04485, partial [Bradymonadaceae bacterium]